MSVYVIFSHKERSWIEPEYVVCTKENLFDCFMERVVYPEEVWVVKAKVGGEKWELFDPTYQFSEAISDNDLWDVLREDLLWPTDEQKELIKSITKELKRKIKSLYLKHDVIDIEDLEKLNVCRYCEIVTIENHHCPNKE
jgi:hypothetical protein